VGEVYDKEIEKALVPLVKHFEFMLGTKPNHSHGIKNISMSKKNVEIFFSKIKSRMHKREHMI